MFLKYISRRAFLRLSACSAAASVLDWRKIRAYAASMGDKKNYPAVVIGAGLGGLCCAAYLARVGIPVTVLEQHLIPGGYATSFDRGDFTFEVSLHGTSIHNNATAQALSELGVLDTLNLMLLPEAFAFKTPALEIAVPQRDPEGFARLLGEHFPEEKEGIKGFIDEITGIAAESTRLNQNKGKFIKMLFPVQYRRMWGVRDKTLADLLDDYVKNPALKDALSFNCGYYGLPPYLLSAFYYAVALGDYLRNGSYYIWPRSQELSNALAKTVEKAGGKALYATPARKILVKDGVVQGVALSNGKVLPAKIVVSNASALTTFKEMLPREAVPGDYLKKLEAYRPSISSFILWLGLNEELRGKAKHYSIGISSGKGADTEFQYAMKGDIEKVPFSINVYDNLSKGYSKPGKSTVTILCLTSYEPWRKFEADYRAGRKEAYNEEKERWAGILIGRAEKEMIPGLSRMIEVKESATPLTNWSFTGNTEGAIYGFEQSLDNAFMNRINNKTPVQGLYLASAWGNPGGGYTGALMGGRSAFRMIMEDLG